MRFLDSELKQKTRKLLKTLIIVSHKRGVSRWYIFFVTETVGVVPLPYMTIHHFKNVENDMTSAVSKDRGGLFKKSSISLTD